MSQIMQHHGCRSQLRDRNKLTGLEERFDLVVDSNDVILERVVRTTALVLYKIASWKSLCNPSKLLYPISRGFFLMKLMGWTGASSLSCLQGFSLPRLSFPAGIARLANEPLYSYTAHASFLGCFQAETLCASPGIQALKGLESFFFCFF